MLKYDLYKCKGMMCKGHCLRRYCFCNTLFYWLIIVFQSQESDLENGEGELKAENESRLEAWMKHDRLVITTYQI